MEPFPANVGTVGPTRALQVITRKSSAPPINLTRQRSPRQVKQKGGLESGGQRGKAAETGPSPLLPLQAVNADAREELIRRSQLPVQSLRGGTSRQKVGHADGGKSNVRWQFGGGGGGRLLKGAEMKGKEPFLQETLPRNVLERSVAVRGVAARCYVIARTNFQFGDGGCFGTSH